jgi:hypothetical protein
MKKFEIEMLLYTLTKKYMEIQWNILNPFGITLIAKWWASLMAKAMCLKPRRPKFNPFYQHILCEICILYVNV